MKPTLEIIADNDSELVASLTSVEEEAPFAIVDGERLTEMPKDLYIPPGALQVFLEAFSGPLDLLLYLIRKQNLDILDIPIADITRQYTQYIELMQELELELAGEYLLMAAMLAEIKSRMLLPRPAVVGEEEEDPRAELVRRLQEYERFKKAAEDLDGLPRMERDALPANAELVERKVVRLQPDVTLAEMLRAIKSVLKRADMFARHHVQREPLSVRQRMTDILTSLQGDAFVPFVSLFRPEEGRMGVTVTFMAVLELMREALVEIVQAEPYAPLHVRPKSSIGAGAAGASAVADAENEAALAQPALEGEDEVEPLDDWSPDASVEEGSQPGSQSNLPSETAQVDAAQIDAEQVDVESIVIEQVDAEQLVVEPIVTEQADAEQLVTEPIVTEQVDAEHLVTELVATEQADAEQLVVELVATEQGDAEQLVVELVATEQADAEQLVVELVATEQADAEQLVAQPMVMEQADAEQGEAQQNDDERLDAGQNESEPAPAKAAADADDVEVVESTTEIR